MISRKDAGEKSITSNIAENSVKIRFFNSYELQVTSYKWICQIVLFPAEKLSYCRFQGYTVHYSLLVIHYKKQNAFFIPPGLRRFLRPKERRMAKKWIFK
jgi:hypothetical protein